MILDMYRADKKKVVLLGHSLGKFIQNLVFSGLRHRRSRVTVVLLLQYMSFGSLLCVWPCMYHVRVCTVHCHMYVPSCADICFRIQDGVLFSAVGRGPIRQKVDQRSHRNVSCRWPALSWCSKVDSRLCKFSHTTIWLLSILQSHIQYHGQGNVEHSNRSSTDTDFSVASYKDV